MRGQIADRLEGCYAFVYIGLWLKAFCARHAVAFEHKTRCGWDIEPLPFGLHGDRKHIALAVAYGDISFIRAAFIARYQKKIVQLLAGVDNADMLVLKKTL